MKRTPISTVSQRPSRQGGSGYGRAKKWGGLAFRLGRPTCPREQLFRSSLRELGPRRSRGLPGLLKIQVQKRGQASMRSTRTKNSAGKPGK